MKRKFSPIKRREKAAAFTSSTVVLYHHHHHHPTHLYASGCVSHLKNNWLNISSLHTHTFLSPSLFFSLIMHSNKFQVVDSEQM